MGGPVPRSEARLGGPGVCWIAGRPSAGKTTLAHRLAGVLRARGRACEVLDSDVARRAITPEPTYTDGERLLFYRSLAFAAGAVAEAGADAVVAATTGSLALMQAVSSACPGVFVVHASCPRSVAEARDPKGLYAAARGDPGLRLPGVGVPYEAPPAPDFVMDTGGHVSDEAVDRLADAFVAACESRPLPGARIR